VRTDHDQAVEVHRPAQQQLATVEGASAPVFALFQQALDKGGEAVAAMETLYKLYAAEREHSARLGFSRALAAFQAECPPVPRSSKAEILTASGTKFGYAYADFEQIVETIGPHLRANGLSISFDSETDVDRLPSGLTDATVRPAASKIDVYRRFRPMPASRRSKRSAPPTTSASSPRSKRSARGVRDEDRPVHPGQRGVAQRATRDRHGIQLREDPDARREGVGTG